MLIRPDIFQATFQTEPGLQGLSPCTNLVHRASSVPIWCSCNETWRFLPPAFFIVFITSQSTHEEEGKWLTSPDKISVINSIKFIWKYLNEKLLTWAEYTKLHHGLQGEFCIYTQFSKSVIKNNLKTTV